MIQNIAQDTNASVRAVCRVLELPRSSFYHGQKPTPTKLEDERIKSHIQAHFQRHQARYGYRRIHAELAEENITCAPTRVRRLMKESDLTALQPRSYVPRTSDGRADKPAENLLRDRPLPTSINQVWTSDITYIRTAEGFAYLTIILDLYSRKIVGWSLSKTLHRSGVIEALSQALQTRRPPSGLILHSDRGSQYGSQDLRKLLADHNLRQSMSAKANPYENAWTESWMGTLKREHVNRQRFENHAQAKQQLFAYIEGYYNTHRKHSALGYLSPHRFEQIKLN